MSICLIYAQKKGNADYPGTDSFDWTAHSLVGERESQQQRLLVLEEEGTERKVKSEMESTLIQSPGYLTVHLKLPAKVS